MTINQTITAAVRSHAFRLSLCFQVSGLLLSAFLAVSQPAQPLTAVDTNTVAAPQTYARTAVWDPSAGATGYTLTVNGALFLTAKTNQPIELVEGTNTLTIAARNDSGASLAVTNFYLIIPQRITGCEIVTSVSVLGPWVKTNSLPSPQTNAFGPPLFIRLQPWLVNTTQEGMVK